MMIPSRGQGSPGADAADRPPSGPRVVRVERRHHGTYTRIQPIEAALSKISGADFALSVSAGVRIRAELTVVSVGDVTVVGGVVPAPCIGHMASLSSTILSFRLADRPEDYSAMPTGRRLGDCAFRTPGREQFFFGGDSGRFGWVVVPPPAVSAALRLLTGAAVDLSPGLPRIVSPAPEVFARLLGLHAEALRRSEQSVEPEDARLLEAALVDATAGCVACLDGPEDAERAARRRRHTAIIDRLRAGLETEPANPVHVSAICRALGVSGGTLQAVCKTYFGMGPKRYLTLRRMQLARHALRRGSPATTTVTDVAANCGFFELGRFAGAYKTLFGESPSETLRRRDHDTSVP